MRATFAYTGARRARRHAIWNHLGLATTQFPLSARGGGQADSQIVVGATVIATLPMILVFFLGQRYVVEGIATQGRKG